ncbi:MAG: hypothetical protein A4E66_00939 [Syntrophus sp. PtaB.Bin001]|nr:MAG: hypothetical protein A4E66_00939 [Syntrophus sp. PtaB.Bin001]
MNKKRRQEFPLTDIKYPDIGAETFPEFRYTSHNYICGAGITTDFKTQFLVDRPAGNGTGVCILFNKQNILGFSELIGKILFIRLLQLGFISRSKNIEGKNNNTLHLFG